MVRRQTLYLLLICSIGHVILISSQVQSRSGLPVIQSVAFRLFAQVQRVTAGTADGLGGLWTRYFALRGAAVENETLRRDVAQLQVALQQQQALIDRVHALETAVGLKQAHPAPTLAARVIAGNPAPGVLTVTIDRGIDDGVAADMAVLGSAGVVGRVVHPVAPRAATVQLLIDSNAAAAVVFERFRSGGMVIGQGADPPLSARYVPALADIQAGERVTTSGQDGIYPPGLLVGTVERVTRRPNGDRDIAVRPAVDFSHVDIVFVVLERAAGQGGPGS